MWYRCLPARDVFARSGDPLLQKTLLTKVAAYRDRMRHVDSRKVRRFATRDNFQVR